MPKPVSLLTVQFLAWVADRPRTYADVMEAWRSNCPRNPVWEDAVIEGLVCFENGSRGTVVLTSLGRTTLARESQLERGPSQWAEAPKPLASGGRAAIFQPSDEDVS
jgi:hypothetical protein